MPCGEMAWVFTVLWFSFWFKLYLCNYSWSVWFGYNYWTVNSKWNDQKTNRWDMSVTCQLYGMILNFSDHILHCLYIIQIIIKQFKLIFDKSLRICKFKFNCKKILTKLYLMCYLFSVTCRSQILTYMFVKWYITYLSILLTFLKII